MIPGTGAVLPRWWPSRFYYGWALVVALGLTATVSYGILSYAFPMFIGPMSTELGWSRTQITGAFSLAQLVAGLAAIPVGRWVDRHGPRALMTGGSVLACVALTGWSMARSLPVFYALMAAMGVAMAAVLYEPAFAVVATWFRRDRGRALTLLTFMGGFASIIFVPIATLLVSHAGWRSALRDLAVVLAVLTALPHLIVLRRRPSDFGLQPDGLDSDGRTSADDRMVITAEETSVPAGDAVRSATFRWLAAAFALSSFTTTAVTVHLVPLLLERGYGIAFAGASMGVLGLMALPGRLVFTPLGGRWPRSVVTASIFGLQALAVAVFLSSRSTTAVWIFVVLFGAGFGAITPARASLVAELFGVAHYGGISGALALLISLARAAAPVGASVLYSTGRVDQGYDVVMFVLLMLCIGSAIAVLRAGDGWGAPSGERNLGAPGGSSSIGSAGNWRPPDGFATLPARRPSPQPARLMRRLVLVLTLVLAPALHSQQDLSKVMVTAVPVTKGIYMLQGAGGNIGLSVGQDDAFVIDDQYAPLTPKIKAAIATVTSRPVRFVMNTHWHGDHTGGNENMAAGGAIVVAHENVRRRMSAEQFIEAFKQKVAASPAAALPVVTFTDAISFYVNDDTIRATHVKNAHTDGDAIIVFTAANVVHMGDTYFNGIYPFIDVSSGGSIDGLIAAADGVLATTNDSTKIIPGHGPLGSKASLREYRGVMADVRSRVAALIDRKRTLAQVIAAKPLADYEATWGKGFLKTDQFLAIVYTSLTRGRAPNVSGTHHAP